ncbi:hypothetical protein TNCV_2362751 [Trichonephila clavipes]|nr:hypothetical protein TNCV_2362751 [Trichonephila clavipes]
MSIANFTLKLYTVKHVKRKNTSDGAVGSLMVRASDSRSEGLVPWQNCGGGDRLCRHQPSLRGTSPSEFVLSPVWCSRPRPITGVLLAPCHDEFRGQVRISSDRWH